MCGLRFGSVLWVCCELMKGKRGRESKTGGYLRAQMVAKNKCLRDEQRTKVIVPDWRQWDNAIIMSM